MREILFRGKRKDNGEWIEGYYCNCVKAVGMETIPSIQQTNDNSLYFREVIPETVGQYTGLTDKNGKKIFEGDIVVVRYNSGEICSIGDVQFDCGVFGAEWTTHKENKTMVGAWGQLHNLRRFDDDIIKSIEVIGNKWDNPELLGE